MTRKTLITSIACTLFSTGLFVGISQAQQVKRPTTKTSTQTRKNHKPKTSDSAASKVDTAKVAAKLAPKDGRCHTKKSGATERNYKFTCRGDKADKDRLGKDFVCNGSRDSSISGMYKTQTCRNQSLPQPNTFIVQVPVGGVNEYSKASHAADFACGCYFEHMNTCDSANCTVDLD